jgi:hypothetical protein
MQEEREGLHIKNLVVHVSVEAGSDEAVFARLFEKHINAWQRLFGEAEQRQRLSERSRALGDREQRWVT